MSFWNRIGLAWHVLLGRPLIYGVKARGLVLLTETSQLKVVGCTFLGAQAYGVETHR